MEASPSSKVFNTIELLEEVLVNLDIEDLFSLQRTSTTFRDVLQSSRFKRKMFLSTSSPIKGDSFSKFDINPFLTDHMFKTPEYDIKFHSSEIEHECGLCSPTKTHISTASSKHDQSPFSERTCCHENLSIWCTLRMKNRDFSPNESPLPLESWKQMRLAKSLPTDVDVTFNVYDPASSSSWPTFGSTVRLLPGQNSFQQLLDVVEREMLKGCCISLTSATAGAVFGP